MSRPKIVLVFICITIIFHLGIFALHFLVSSSGPPSQKSTFPFLIVGPSDHQLKYGVFGYTNGNVSKTSVGYHFVHPTNFAIQIPTTTQEMTRGLILHPFAVAFSCNAAIAGYLSLTSSLTHKWHHTYFSVSSLFAALVTFAVWILTFSFATAWRKYTDLHIPAKFGKAFLFTQLAFVASCVATAFNYYISSRRN